MQVNLHKDANPDAMREVLDALPVLVLLEHSGKITFANAEARHVLGTAEGEWVPRPVEELFWGLRPGTAEPQTVLTGTQRGKPFHASLRTSEGKLLPIEGIYSVLNVDLREAVIVAHPSEREQAPKSQLMEDVLASLPEAVAIEYQNHILYTNPAFTRMFGYTAEEASGGSLRELIVPETRLNENAASLKAVEEHGLVMLETVRANKTGELVDVSLQVAPLLVNQANVGYVFTFRDISEHRDTEQKLQHDAMHDVLTGLPNRALFLDRMNLTMSRRLRNAEYGFGVLYLDLDHFKQVNDELGHASGDVLLTGVAGRLRATLRPQDSAARLGGDEFAVLVEDILSPSDLEIVAARILRELEREFEVYGRTVHADASIGAAMAGPEHTTPELLLRDADFALYRAKQAGRGKYEVFDKHLEVVVTSRQERERELRSAVEKRQFVFQYEPIYRLGNGKLEGFEAFLRLRRADGSIENLHELYAVAEDAGMSILLVQETLAAVCAEQRALSDRLPQQELILSMNLTRRQLYHPDLITNLMRALTSGGADPSHLLFEAQESAFNEDPDAAVAILQRLGDWQLRVAVDDFGSSLAPLNYLVQLPVAMVKLAPRLTAAAVSAGRQTAVLESLVRLGNTLGLQIVAQGIQTQEQLAALAHMGCALGQGPLFSAALDADDALDLAEAGYWALPKDA
jgi:Amt family ammonium transporter